MTNDLPQNFITMSARSTDAQLAPSDCGTFEVDVGRIPSVFARAYLVYSSKGAFRPFVLRRSINGLAETGGAWVDGDGTIRTSAEEIDPSVLHLGSNEVSLCVPKQIDDMPGLVEWVFQPGAYEALKNATIFPLPPGAL